MNIINRLLGRRKTSSKDIAKDRLQLVLVHDRVNLSQDKMGQLKDDLIRIISKYVEIDQEGINISLTKSGRQSRLTADIPIVGARQEH